MQKSCPVLTERDEIVIKGKKLYWNTFIHDLDYLNRKLQSNCLRGNFSGMIYALQSVADSYYNGADIINDDMKSFLEYYHMKVPAEDKLPEAIETLFIQLEKELSMNLSGFLDECEKNSKTAVLNIKKQIEEHKNTVEYVRSLISGYEDFDSADVLQKVTYLINLEQAKQESTIYNLKKVETDITCLWTELLIRSISMDTVTQSQIKRAVEDGIVEEYDITDLLKDKYNEKRDYEWYMENFIGCELDETTVIKIDDFLELCEVRFKELLNLS